tara:strand:- start:626 stop:1129 length:504 start_codon:yes stop_codon:yes gene_type:complete
MSGVRIAFTGPECSGKSTMAKWLADEYSLKIVEEYAREYLQKKKGYSIHDLDVIAAEQFVRNSSQGPLIADTEMLVLKIWSEEKYQRVSKNILQLLKQQEFDFYFLCKPDFNWVSDPLRENALDRERLFDLYEESLKKHKYPYCLLSGPEVERKEIIKTILANKNIL